MKLRIAALLAASMASCLSMTPNRATAEDVAQDKDTSPRKVFRAERPDPSRGWVIVAKENYWPLRYEPMDSLAATQALIGKSSPQELADALDKSASWLRLVTSVSANGDESTTSAAAELCDEAAEDLRSEGGNWDERKLNQLIVLSNLGIAKSHVLRAALADDQNTKPMRKPTKKVTGIKSKDIDEANKEIASNNRQRAIAQFRFDARNSYQHLETAQSYLSNAAKLGGLKLESSITDEIPEMDKDTIASDLVDYVSDELRPRTSNFLAVTVSEFEKIKKTNFPE